MTNLVVSMAGEAYDPDEQRVQIGNPGSIGNGKKYALSAAGER